MNKAKHASFVPTITKFITLNYSLVMHLLINSQVLSCKGDRNNQIWRLIGNELRVTAGFCFVQGMNTVGIL